MEHKKYEQLIDLIINEQEDKARELFHEIVVEKSREIYESIMDEEMMDEGSQMHGQVGDLLDEINVEETGMTEEEDLEVDVEDEEDMEDVDGDEDFESEEDVEMSDGEGLSQDEAEEVKDDFEALLNKFEAMLSGDDSEEAMMEAVQLQKVSVTHGDDGAQKKSPVPANSGAKGMDSKPVKFSGDHEAVPNGPKGPSNEYSKKEGDLPGAGSFKNVPGGKAKVDLSAAPKPVTKDGSANSKSPVAKG